MTGSNNYQNIQAFARSQAQEAYAFIQAQTLRDIATQSKLLQKMLEQLRNMPR